MSLIPCRTPRRMPSRSPFVRLASKPVPRPGALNGFVLAHVRVLAILHLAPDEPGHSRRQREIHLLNGHRPFLLLQLSPFLARHQGTGEIAPSQSAPHRSTEESGPDIFDPEIGHS